jgi:hypothetical protein
MALSGQRSRISKIIRTRGRLKDLTNHAGIAVTKGGDVAMTMSGRAARQATVTEEMVKPKKAQIRPR